MLTLQVSAGCSTIRDLVTDRLAEFFYRLDRNVEDVAYFYNKKFGETTRRSKLLQDRYGHTMDISRDIDREELEDLMAALLELRGQLRKLQWYGEVNRRGFIKITKKLDKKVQNVCAQKRYLSTKVDTQPFANNSTLSEEMTKINDWLSTLGDVKLLDDASSSHSSYSLVTMPSKAQFKLPPDTLEQFEQTIHRDDAQQLSEILEQTCSGFEEPKAQLVQRLKLNLLQRSISHQSTACIAAMLGQLETLEEPEEMNKRNCIHRLVILIGRSKSTVDAEESADLLLELEADSSSFITPATAPTLRPAKKKNNGHESVHLLGKDDKAVSTLDYLLTHLKPSQREAVLAKDLSGRTPLHYAAQFGFVVLCDLIIEHLEAWGIFDVREGIDGPNWQDVEGWAPLHLAVIGGHPLTTKALLDAERRNSQSENPTGIRRHSSKSSAVLALATKANLTKIVESLVQAGIDINYQDEQGETALHVAARFNHEECARMFLSGTDYQKANTELAETTYGWTPLFIACVDGNLAVAELLISAGADVERVDLSGWAAKEHASLRGHLAIARRLAEVAPAPYPTEEIEGQAPSPPPSSPPLSSSLTDRRSNGLGNGNGNGNGSLKVTEPVKSFGHRYLQNESMVLVSLGTMDMRKNLPAVKLDKIPLAEAHSTQLDTPLSIVVSASGAKGESEIFDLPVEEHVSTDPIVFTSSDPSNVRLLFDLVPTYAGSKERIVGRGVAMLSSIKPTIGSKRINLQGDLTVPIIAANTLDIIGSVTFNFLIITPFSHPNMSVNENQTYWKSMASTMVIGHRGLGKNMLGRNSLQLGENTIDSFIAAANLGASYVEFDVQLTKDHVPVIYHDFLVSETGIDAPVHTLTLEQFLHVSDGRTPRTSRPASPVLAVDPKVQELRGQLSRRHRSLSLGGHNGDKDEEMNEKMKHTRDFKKKGFKGNSRGSSIQSPFATLEEMFKKLPPGVGFNIEMSKSGET